MRRTLVFLLCSLAIARFVTPGWADNAIWIEAESFQNLGERNYELSWVSHVTGKRESRRLLGDYVMTEQDVANQTLFPDRVSYCGWGIDLHPPGGFYSQQPPAEFNFRVKSSVPFRSLYTKDIDNLMMAGRCISVSHVALGTTRVMITCGLQGQAVGTAAAMCRQLGVGPRQLGTHYIDQLQQTLLADGCYLIDLPNHDPRDLARKARVTASSEAPSLRLEDSLGRGDVHSLDRNDRGVMFRSRADRIRSISLYLGSDNRKPTDVTLQLYSARKLDDFAAMQTVAEAQATLRPRASGWVSFDLNVPVESGGYYFAMVPRISGVRWWLFASQPRQTTRAYRVMGSNKPWVPSTGCYCFRVDPPADMEMAPPPGATTKALFAPANVTNGYARAVRGWPNCWRPDPDAKMPQWIQLAFAQSEPFDTVHVSYQTKELSASGFHLDTYRDGEWKTVARRTDNQQRRCVIHFPRQQSDRIRLVIDKAERNMGVCEIRVYDSNP